MRIGRISFGEQYKPEIAKVLGENVRRDALMEVIYERDLMIDVLTHGAAEVEAENARYKAALERIASHAKWYAADGNTERCDQTCMDQVIGLAKAALHPSDQEDFDARR